MVPQVVLEHILDENTVGWIRCVSEGHLANFNPLDLKKRNILFYHPLGPFSLEGNAHPGEVEVRTIESLIAAGKWYEVR